MFYGQKYYIEKMLPKKIKAPLVSTDFNIAFRWLHNNFNKCFMISNSSYPSEFLYVDEICGPSDYKKEKAIMYLNRYATHEMPYDIQKGSPLYMKCAAVYYYAAKIIEHYFPGECAIQCKKCNILYESISRLIRVTITKNLSRLKEDHYALIERKAGLIASLTVQLSSEYKQLGKLMESRPETLAKYIEKGVLKYAEGSKNMQNM